MTNGLLGNERPSLVTASILKNNVCMPGVDPVISFEDMPALFRRPAAGCLRSFCGVVLRNVDGL